MLLLFVLILFMKNMILGLYSVGVLSVVSCVGLCVSVVV